MKHVLLSVALETLLFGAPGTTLVAEETLGAQPNIIVIFTDDHGYADLSCQGVLDDVNTPHVDATAVALAGLAHDPNLDGVNLVPFLLGQKESAPHEALYWRWNGQAAVRQGQWKYLQGGSRRYLFNLEDDPEESRNLLCEYPEVGQRLADNLSRWAAQMRPSGLPDKISVAASRYFDFYLDGKPAPPGPRAAERTTKRPGPSEPRRDPADVFRQRDADRDGLLTLNELIGNPDGRNVPVLTKRFRSLDGNNDGNLTIQEFTGEKAE